MSKQDFIDKANFDKLLLTLVRSGRFDVEKVKALPEVDKRFVVRYLIKTMRPILKEFADTPAALKKLKKHNYTQTVIMNNLEFWTTFKIEEQRKII